MSARAIWTCWAALLALLAATTAIAFLPLGPFNLALALAIAGAKALLVLVFFMELRHASGLVRAFALAGFFWLTILLGLTAADYTSRHDDPIPLAAPVRPGPR